MKKIPLLLLALLVCGAAFSQVKLTLAEAVRIALAENYDLQIAENTSEIAIAQNKMANANFMPTLDFIGSTQNSVNNVNQELSSGQKIARNGAKSNNLNAALNLSFTLFDGFKMFATKQKSAVNEQISELQFKQKLQETIAQVSLQYYTVVQQQQQLKALEEAIAISEERVKIATAKFNVGAVAKTDLLQSKVDLNAQKSAYLKQKALLPLAKAELNRLLARNETSDFSVDEAISTSYQVDKERINQQIAEENISLQLAKQELRIYEESVKEIRADLLPKLTFNSSYVFSQAESQAGFLLKNQNLGLNYGFGVTMPLFRGFKNYKALQVAQIASNSALLQQKITQSSVNIALQKALLDYENYLAILALETENISLAKENVTIALERFRLAQSDILALKEAQKSLDDAQTRLITARYNTKASEIALRLLLADIVE